jgi:histidyl-tRNA synthetase
MVTVFNDELAPASRRLAADFREAGFRTDIYPTTEDGLGKQFGYADDRDIPYVVLVAPQEHEQGIVGIQEMDSGEKAEIDRSNAVEWLQNETG